MCIGIFMEPNRRVLPDGVNRDFGDDPEDFEYKKRYNYQDQDWSNAVKGDFYECKCDQCEGNEYYDSF